MPKLRIHFTEGDLGRTRLRLDTDPMWEIVGSVHILQHGDGGPYFDDWRRYAGERVARSDRLRAAVRMLATIIPCASHFPDFPTPATDLPDLSRNDTAAPRGLRAALHLYTVEVIKPYDHVIADALRAERSDRIDTYLNHGAAALLTTFEPTMTWRHPVLTVDYPVDRDLHLRGRGLLLAPCYFHPHQRVALADPELRPTLVFPLRPESRLLPQARHTDDLGALLGSTRADILRSLSTDTTTTRLAVLNNITPATVSHHTSVLRNAGLITTRRDSNRAIHALTPLGMRLLARA